MKTTSLLLLLTAACTNEGSVGTIGPTNGRVQVALLAPNASQDIDLLFIVDDSPGMLEIQQSLVSGFPGFIEAVSGLPTGMPSLQIGVVSTDLGTKGAADPEASSGIGAGPGSCAGRGKNGLLVTSASLTEPFIRDVATGGARSTNYTGTLAEAFSSIASLGAEGCGFEQSLQAAELALTKPENAGLVRPTAKLAVVVLTNEDDCSVARGALLGNDTNTLGPLQSFRCTRFGVTCEQGGKTPDEMNQIGEKRNCHANETVGYLTSVRDHAIALMSMKPDPRDVLFLAIAGEAATVAVEMRTQPGGGSATPALQVKCAGAATAPFGSIDPSVRLTDHAKAFPRGRVTTMCGGNVHGPLLDLAREIRGLLGDACLTRDVSLPADCEAFDTHLDGSMSAMRACTRPGSGDCWELVADPGCIGQGQRLHVVRTLPAASDSMVSLRCK